MTLAQICGVSKLVANSHSGENGNKASAFAVARVYRSVQ